MYSSGWTCPRARGRSSDRKSNVELLNDIWYGVCPDPRTFSLELTKKRKRKKNIVNRRMLFYIIRNYFFYRRLSFFHEYVLHPEASIISFATRRHLLNLQLNPHLVFFFSLALSSSFVSVIFPSHQDHHVLDYFPTINFITSISPTLSLALSSSYTAYREQCLISNLI